MLVEEYDGLIRYCHFQENRPFTHEISSSVNRFANQIIAVSRKQEIIGKLAFTAAVGGVIRGSPKENQYFPSPNRRELR